MEECCVPRREREYERNTYDTNHHNVRATDRRASPNKANFAIYSHRKMRDSTCMHPTRCAEH